MMGRESLTTFTVFIEGDDEGFNLFRLRTTGRNGWWFLWWIPRTISWQGCCNASTPIVVHTTDSRGKALPHFTGVDYVLVAGASRQRKHRKLMSAWPGPWRFAPTTNIEKNEIDADLVCEQVPN